jgi:hypothetical protein
MGRPESVEVAIVNPFPYRRAKIEQAKDAGRLHTDVRYAADRERRTATVCSRRGGQLFRDHDL